MNYYIHTKTDNQGDHEVHEEGCPWLPDVSNRIYLGSYSNCTSAVIMAVAMGYTPANGCYYCCNACHTS